jgi:type IV pilus assembly protein PilY1
MQVSFRFDVGENKTVVDRYSDSNPVDGLPDTLDAYGIDVDAVNNLWEAGTKLFLRDPATDTRKIMTTLTPGTLMDFTSDNGPAGLLKPYLQAASLDEAKDIINYTLGFDIPGYRSRTVESGGVTGVWKLGDIVTSTPKLQSPVPFNNYYTVYRDATYSEFTASKNYRSYGTAYAGANDGMLHAFDFGIFQEAWFGQNRRLEPARLFTTDVNKLGRERWAFIPKNILPYLKYLANTGYCHIFSVDASPIIFDAAIHAPTGCAGPYWDCPKQTVYSSNDKALDLPKTSWRTVLVGSLRLGGACKGTATPCPDVSGDGLKDCVNTPVDVAGQSIGYSSYFALDITDQENPKLLWEFSDNDIPLAERLTGGLGYSTAGPAFMRISARNVVGAASEPDTTKNGRWFVVLASGPTGPIDTAKRQFEARSDQPLKLFVLDLLTGQLAAPAIKPGIDNAFAGSLLGGKVDYDLDYQDDVLYFGYTKKCNATDNLCTVNTWSDGGVLRLTTNEDLSGNITNTTALNPGNWKVSTLMSDTGPVTSAVANLVVRGSTGAAKQGWLYYGTGRYFFRDDDLKNQRILFGVQEPCVKLMGGFHPEICLDTNPDASLEFCAAPVSGAGPDTCGDLYNVTTGVELDPAIYGSDEFKGWYINLESPTNDNAVAGGITAGALGNRTATAERVMTDPVAVPNGAVFFTTFAPTDDICSFGGNTFLWRVKYDTGSFIPMSGSALLQLSTGEIKELDMKTAFADKIANIDSNINNVGEGGLEGMTAGRRTGAMIGVPPVGQGLSLVISPTPIDRMIHIKKR